jgi:hypothetical protein
MQKREVGIQRWAVSNSSKKALLRVFSTSLVKPEKSHRLGEASCARLKNK